MAFGKWSGNSCIWLSTDTMANIDTELNTTIGGTSPAIGSIVNWTKSLSGVPSTLPNGWVECNGQVLSDSDSPLDGVTLPDLNVTQRFLRGNSTSGGTGGSNTHSHSLSNSYDATSTSGGATTSFDTSESGSSLPSYYEMVFIIRVK